MVTDTEILAMNRENYQFNYSKQTVFLRYPADWIIRFHNMYLKRYLPQGRVLDYGCGSGNNSIFFIEQGYETYGVEVVEATQSLIKANLEKNHLDVSLAKNFSIISPDFSSLPFQSEFFDIIVSNQVLYYLPSKERIGAVCRELSRVLRPGGVVFFTMIGPTNYLLTHHTKQVHPGKIHEITMPEEHRLAGIQQFLYLVQDEEELKDLFLDFQCLTVGYFDQRMFDLHSNFHWIFVGKKS